MKMIYNVGVMGDTEMESLMVKSEGESERFQLIFRVFYCFFILFFFYYCVKMNQMRDDIVDIKGIVMSLSRDAEASVALCFDNTKVTNSKKN